MPAHAGPDRISVLIASYHVNNKKDFNETNPGLFLTWEEDIEWTLGIYTNSYHRTSVAAAAQLPVAGGASWSIAVFGGAAYYPGDGRHFAVAAGDVVPLAGLHLRWGPVFAMAIPLDGKTADGILAMGLTVPIGRR